MNNKLLITVYVPMIEKNYDMYIPIVKKIGSIKKLIGKIVEDSSDGIFVYNENNHLYDKKTGEIFDENQFVKYSSIKNGSRVVLY